MYLCHCTISFTKIKLHKLSQTINKRISWPLFCLDMCFSFRLILFLGLVNISLQDDHVLFKKRIDAHDVSNDVSHDADDDADNDMAANLYHADSNTPLEVELNERKEKKINKDDEHAMRRLIEGFLGNKEVLYIL